MSASIRSRISIEEMYRKLFCIELPIWVLVPLGKRINEMYLLTGVDIRAFSIYAQNRRIFLCAFFSFNKFYSGFLVYFDSKYKRSSSLLIFPVKAIVTKLIVVV